MTAQSGILELILAKGARYIMKKFLLTVGLAISLSLPVYSVQAQYTVTREDAIEWIQMPVESEPLSDEEAATLLAEWEAATLENGTIANEDGTILPEFLPEGLVLDQAATAEILTYLEEFRVNEENPEESTSEEESSEESSESEGTSESEESDESEEEESEEEPEEDEGPLADYLPYQRLVDEYYSTIMEADVENIPESLNADVVEEIVNEESERTLYFSLYDIDGNGIEELLLSLDQQIFEVYSTDGEIISPYFNDEYLSQRSYLTIFDNGHMIVQASGGAEYAEYSLYEISGDGLVVTELDRIMYDSVGAPEGTPYYRESEEDVYYTQEEFEEMFGLTEMMPVDITTLDLYPIIPEDTEEEEETVTFDPELFPYGVDFAEIGEYVTFGLETVNAPTQIDLDLVNGQLTTSFEGEMVNTYSVVFDYIETTPIRAFSQANPGEIKDVQVNSLITVNELLEGDRDEVVGQSFYLYYNDEGGISLATPNFAGNVEEADRDVMLEYYLQ